MGNFFRGAPVKEFTQISHKLLGAGLIAFVSCFVKIILLASKKEGGSSATVLHSCSILYSHLGLLLRLRVHQAGLVLSWPRLKALGILFSAEPGPEPI